MILVNFQVMLSGFCYKTLFSRSRLIYKIYFYRVNLDEVRGSIIRFGKKSTTTVFYLINYLPDK